MTVRGTNEFLIISPNGTADDTPRTAPLSGDGA